MRVQLASLSEKSRRDGRGRWVCSRTREVGICRATWGRASAEQEADASRRSGGPKVTDLVPVRQVKYPPFVRPSGLSAIQMKRGPPISGPRPPYCLIGAATCICFRARRARFCRCASTTTHWWHPLRLRLLCSDDLGRQRPGAVARCSPPNAPRSSLIDICAHLRLAPRTQPISRRAALARRCSNTSSFGQLQGPQQPASSRARAIPVPRSEGHRCERCRAPRS